MEHARPPQELSIDGSPVSRADAWKRWKTQFNLFLKASGVHKEEGGVQASLLINLIGSDGFDIYQTFTFQNDAERDDVKTVIKKFDLYFGVKVNVTLARYNFFTRNQEEGETIGQYVVALRLLSKNCSFSTLEEELIRDRIVCGIRSTVVRDRLLRADELSLDKAIKICEADEVSSDGKRCLDARGVSSGASTSSALVEAVSVRGAGAGAHRSPQRGPRGWGRGQRAAAAEPGQQGPSQQRVQCRGCGKGQQCAAGICPAVNVQCFVCRNYGHFARQCNMVSGTNDKVEKMFDIEVSEDSADDSEFFYISVLTNAATVHSTRSERDEWYELLKCDGGFEKFKLDTGADINVLSYGRFKSLGFDDSLIKSKHNMRLQSYSGNIIPIRGVCDLSWYHKNNTYTFRFAIANMVCESVLGRQTCTQLGLINRIHSVNSRAPLRERYDDEAVSRGVQYQVKMSQSRLRQVSQECSNAPCKEPMIPVPIPKLPWNKIGADIFEYQKKYFLIMVDYYSDFVEVAKLNNITSHSVINAMKENFSRHGIPDTLVSDNGTQFTSRDFRSFAAEWGFEQVTSSLKYAQSNGKSERAVQTLKNIIKKSVMSGTDFYLDLLSYRNTSRDNLNSPAQMLMGRKLKCRLPVQQEQQKRSKLYYDKHSKITV